jgi:hypothetical protein
MSSRAVRPGNMTDAPSGIQDPLALTELDIKAALESFVHSHHGGTGRISPSLHWQVQVVMIMGTVPSRWPGFGGTSIGACDGNSPGPMCTGRRASAAPGTPIPGPGRIGKRPDSRFPKSSPPIGNPSRPGEIPPRNGGSDSRFPSDVKVWVDIVRKSVP